VSLPGESKNSAVSLLPVVVLATLLTNPRAESEYQPWLGVHSGQHADDAKSHVLDPKLLAHQGIALKQAASPALRLPLRL
jgi:hypothetical protein